MSLTAVRDGDLSRPAAPTPAARRQRRHRARRKQGRFVAPVEVTCEMITALVDQGELDEADSSDLDRIANIGGKLHCPIVGLSQFGLVVGGALGPAFRVSAPTLRERALTALLRPLWNRFLLRHYTTS